MDPRARLLRLHSVDRVVLRPRLDADRQPERSNECRTSPEASIEPERELVEIRGEVVLSHRPLCVPVNQRFRLEMMRWTIGRSIPVFTPLCDCNTLRMGYPSLSLL